MFCVVGPDLRIRLDELEFSFSRSSGPGGQNVNKVNSKATLRWNLPVSRSFSPEVKAKLLARLGSRLSSDGFLVITSDRYRDQLRNRDDCIGKLRTIVLGATFVPKTRKKSRPSKSSQRKLRESKGRHSEKKKMRGARFRSE